MISAIKYLPAFTGPLALWISLNGDGWISWLTVIYLFVLIPLLEFVLPAPEGNMDKVEEQLAKKDRFYDFFVYAMLPVQYALLLYFCSIIGGEMSSFDRIGKIFSMGICCGAFGINVAHELGHRHTWYEKLMAKVLLLSSLYMHFYIEHNRGHHLQVSTPDDPASARYGENVFSFFYRSVTQSYISAWHLENKRLRKKEGSAWSLNNEMAWYSIIQISFCAVIALWFGLQVMLYFILAAIIGFLLLELVNYIEHYGLVRRINEFGAYERVMPVHSWNSNHFLGRVLLFELTRHSDHHYRPDRKYQILRHFEKSPQLPAGYPAMMLLALCPPIWFHVMHKQIDGLRKARPNLLV